MSRKGRKSVKNGSKKIVILIILLVVFIGGGFYAYKLFDEKQIEKRHEEKRLNILSHYSDYVITSKDTSLYKYVDDNYVEAGKVSANQELTLKETEINYDTKYFKVSTFEDEYYISYKDIDKIEELSENDDRYKKYIVFNQNIVTKDTTSFYDEDDLLVYTLNKSFDLPIIIKDTYRYGVEYNNRLLYVKKDDVSSLKESKNTNLKNTPHIGALNYHFFWDDETESIADCNQVICHSKSQFKSHLDLINEMNLLTLQMKEAEMYIDGKIQLPKSIVITIDDGWRAALGIKILNEYKMYGTVFLITSSYNPEYFRTEDNKYVELHSHTDKMHDGGVCPGGQGGGIKCLPRETILNDLKTSREKLNGSTVLCYPFYEYNNYSIELVKEAGFTMAFAGESSYQDNHFTVGSNKYSLPRFVIVTYTTMNDLRSYFS